MKLLRTAALLPIALALAACGGEADDAAAGPPTGEPIAAIPAPQGTQSWLEVASETPEGGFVVGNPDAPLKLVEYASHTCGACANFAAEGAPELDEYVETGVVSYEIRNLIRDPLDLTIAMAARCGSAESFHPLALQAWGSLNTFFENASQQGAAMQSAMQLPEDRRFVEIANLAGLPEFFAARGISADQLNQCLANSEQANAILERSTQQAEELEIQGTPTFILNGRKLDVNQWPGLEPILQNAGAR